ncbi:MAG: DNA polymerase I [Alphaproteobacteria bacterium]|nr:DNA polymerase I [Alphaproteobacteria bacterium]
MPPSPERTLYLIDGSGFIFRAFFGLPDMTAADGTHVNAVYGFCNMLQKLLNDLKAHHIAVIFDAARKTFRNDIYPEYKAHRPDVPPELIPQFSLIREATRAYGIPAIEAENYEADDIIAAYARIAHDAGYNVCIVSSDKDLMQLIRPGVELYDSMKSISIKEAQVLEKFGVPPEKVIDVQALAGDSTDNVPGVPGIGIKTAAQLINEYGDLETLLARASEIKQPKRREVLIQNADMARISKRLVTLDDHAPTPLPIEELHPRNYKQEDLVAFLEKMGFRSILARLKQPTPTAPQPHENKKELPPPANRTDLVPESVSYELIQEAAQLRPWIKQAKEQGYIALDTETTSLVPSTTKLVGVSLATAPGKACYIPIGHIDPNDTGTDGCFSFTAAQAPKQMNASAMAAELRDLLADESVIKIAHNLKFDLQVLEQHGLNILSYDDTMLLSYALEAGLHGHGLDELAMMHFQHKMISFTEVTGSGKSKITFDRVPLEQATNYAAEDADFTLRLWLLLKPRIAQQNLSRIYERIEKPLIPVVASMERNGIEIDPAVLKEQSNALTLRLKDLEKEIHKLAGHEFNVGSPKQLGDVLFGELGLPGSSKGKNGAYSTGHDILEPLAEMGNEIVTKVLDWRAIAKLKSTYTDALPEQIDAKTGRIHTSFSLVGAATGRLSSTDPNLQNIPIRTPDGRAIRKAFIAPEGYKLLSVDYSQIELRLAAEIAGIKALIQAFHDKEDIHALTASQVFGIPLKEMTSEKRRQAKAINFGIIYGISGFGLAKQIGCSPKEANEFIRQYLDRFHELRDWIEDTRNFAREHGYVETLFGRRVHITGMRDKSANMRNFAERQATNAPLQGTAADIMKRAMIRMPHALCEENLNAKLLLQVHDELVFEVPIPEIDATSKLVRKIMQEAPLPSIKMQVPLIAEAGHADNWAEAH